ncbi:cuticle protein 10.9-like [Tropilaelaps mercedesae]|uniref:Cuticle protein 10.9-like n=1 Tax=Tropilaelaps mercedesae TaxID=418985 RepID=A0A1V9XG32_9ACAR|nr:cuticle protein 10.9-like [Tropilaelaps mercedesae]
MKFLSVIAMVAMSVVVSGQLQSQPVALRRSPAPAAGINNVVNNGAYTPNQAYAPTPFEYAYASEDPEGSHSATQSGDAEGRMQGSYTITLADGRQRTVNYVADENGYRAEITTNELGTENRNPADVLFSSSAITGQQAAIQYGPPAPQRQVVATRPSQLEVPLRQPNSQVALPSYGTFAGVNVARRV